MRESRKNMERMQFYLEPALTEALAELANKEGVSIAAIIRRSLRRTIAEHRGTSGEGLSIIGLFSVDPKVAKAAPLAG